MEIYILTLFPELFPGPLAQSVIGNALKAKKWTLHAINIRDFGIGKHKKVDDKPFSGGPGMVLRADVVDAAVQDATELALKNHNNSSIKYVYFSPRGEVLKQETLQKIRKKHSAIIILCGRYEGVDQRVIEKWQFQEISIGDYVLTNGDLAAMVFLDGLIRLVPSVLGNSESSESESFSDNLLEPDQYTQPADWHGKLVPSVLRSGNHTMIEQWKRAESEKITRGRRLDLWWKYIVNKGILDKKE